MFVSNASNSLQSDRIQYTITPHGEGVILCVWETNLAAQSEADRFLFKINHRVASHAEAQALLNGYLEAATTG